MQNTIKQNYKKVDVYFSASMQMNSIKWFEEHDMPVVNINGVYMPYSEMISHGDKPTLNRNDLIFIGTLNKCEMDIKIVNKMDFIANSMNSMQIH